MDTIMDQKNIFIEGEGDVWFSRNKESLTNRELMQELEVY